MRPLGETPQISGPVVLIILLVLALVLVAVGVIICLGCVLARRAGRGDRKALVLWAVIAVPEVLLTVVYPLIGVALLVQAVLYLRARLTPPPAAGRGGPPTP